MWCFGLWPLQRGQGLPYDLWLDICHHETSWLAWLIECLTALSIYVTAQTLSTHQNREQKPHTFILCVENVIFLITSNLLTVFMSSETPVMNFWVMYHSWPIPSLLSFLRRLVLHL